MRLFQFSRMRLQVRPCCCSLSSRNRNRVKISRNQGSIRKSRMVFGRSTTRPVGSSMWQIFFFSKGYMMLVMYIPISPKSFIIYSTGNSSETAHKLINRESSVEFNPVSTILDRFPRMRIPITIDSSVFMEYFRCTFLWSAKQYIRMRIHANSYMIYLTEQLSSLPIRQNELNSMKVQKVVSSSRLNIIGRIFSRRIPNMVSAIRYSWRQYWNRGVLLRLECTSCANTSLLERMKQIRNTLPSRAYDPIVCSYFSVGNPSVKQLSTYSNGYSSIWIVISVAISIHSTGDLSFNGQQSLNTNHSAPIRAQSIMTPIEKKRQMQTFELTSSSAQQISQPQKSLHFIYYTMGIWIMSLLCPTGLQLSRGRLCFQLGDAYLQSASQALHISIVVVLQGMHPVLYLFLAPQNSVLQLLQLLLGIVHAPALSGVLLVEKCIDLLLKLGQSALLLLPLHVYLDLHSEPVSLVALGIPISAWLAHKHSVVCDSLMVVVRSVAEFSPPQQGTLYLPPQLQTEALQMLQSILQSLLIINHTSSCFPYCCLSSCNLPSISCIDPSRVGDRAGTSPPMFMYCSKLSDIEIVQIQFNFANRQAQLRVTNRYFDGKM